MENCIDYVHQAELLKALAHPVRLQIVHTLLKEGGRNVRCIETKTNASQSNISQHLQKLRAVGIVVAERNGNEVYYRAACPKAALLMAALTGEEDSRYVV